MELQRSKTAKALNDLLRPYKPREPLPYIEIVKLITEALAKKAVRYGYNVCADLDALVYVNLLSNVLDPNSSIPNTEELVKQGWRSVSMIMPLYSHVFFATDSTPGFLRDFTGQTRNECTNLDILFEL
jgi:hypothetical protein